MTPEALDAITSPTMRPSALEAATNPNLEQTDKTPSEKERPHSPASPKKPPTPFGQRIDGTQSAARVVEEAVHGVKAAVSGAIAWAEKKADSLSSESDSVGPYTSPATCAPSDLDPIVSGVLPVILTQEKNNKGGGENADNDDHKPTKEKIEEVDKDKKSVRGSAQ